MSSDGLMRNDEVLGGILGVDNTNNSINNNDTTTTSGGLRVRNTIRSRMEGGENNNNSNNTNSNHRKSRSSRSVTATAATAAIDTDNAFAYTAPPSHSSDNSGSGDDNDDDDDDSEDQQQPFEMSLAELLYSSSSYYAIAKPVTITMVLSALAVCLINTDQTKKDGADAMAQSYQVWHVNNNSNIGTVLATSLANAFVFVCVICIMTYVIVCLYHYKFMKCIVGYMMFASCSLLGLLGSNLAQTAISIYRIPVDKVSFGIFMLNFAFVGVLAIFFGKGIPKVVTQGYLICTSVILAWHLNYFDVWMTWTLLFMLALYDLCAVLTPCGPLKWLVNLMSRDDAPDMPGLLYEAELPPEAKRPPRSSTTTAAAAPTPRISAVPETSTTGNDATTLVADNTSRTVKIPLAIAKVYQLPVISVPKESMKIIFPSRFDSSNISASPLLNESDGLMISPSINIPEYLTPQQLRCDVTVQLPQTGGSIVSGSRRNKKVYYEHDRYNEVKRILWVDQRTGKVFAEMKSNDEESPDHNSIRLGLGDFIFYSVLVAKAAQYSFATFAVCALVILSGLGSTLVLLSVYGHALPALPISIFLGVIFYITTRFFMEPWIEIIMSYEPYYA